MCVCVCPYVCCVMEKISVARLGYSPKRCSDFPPKRSHFVIHSSSGFVVIPLLFMFEKLQDLLQRAVDRKKDDLEELVNRLQKLQPTERLPPATPSIVPYVLGLAPILSKWSNRAAINNVINGFLVLVEE